MMSDGEPKFNFINLDGINKRDRTLEKETGTAIYNAAVQRCPGIDGPASIWKGCRPHQWVPVSLAYVGEIFQIDENAN